MTTRDFDCVLGFSFGFRRDGATISPGISNEDLARVVALRHGPLPKILQFEIADVLDHGKEAPDIWRIERNHRRPGAYLDTRNVAEQAAHLMAENGWTTAAIVAHPVHLARTRRVCEHLGIRTDDGQIREMACESVRFDPKSAQRWTRSRALYIPHEVVARAAYTALRYV